MYNPVRPIGPYIEHIEKCTNGAQGVRKFDNVKIISPITMRISKWSVTMSIFFDKRLPSM